MVSRTVGVEVGSMEGERQTRKGSMMFHLLDCMHAHNKYLSIIKKFVDDQYQYLYRACLPDNNGEL